MIRNLTRSGTSTSPVKACNLHRRRFTCSSSMNDASQQSDFLETFIQQHEPENQAIEYFRSKDWTRKILEDPAYELIPFYPRYHNKSTNENRFFARVVNTPSTIEHILALRRKDFGTNKPANHGDNVHSTRPELLCLMSLGSDLDSHPSIAHGGFQSVLFDEVAWVLIMLHQNATSQPGPREKNYTVSLNTKFIAPAFTPSDVLFDARLAKREGRKWWIQSDMMNDAGKVLTSSESFWITAKKP